MKRQFLFACLAIVLTAPAVVAVRPLPAQANGFCGAESWVLPWDQVHNAPAPASSTSESAVRVVLYTAGGSSAMAIVTLITNDSAYQAELAGIPVRGNVSAPVIVTFPHPVDVQFAYVDSYALNGGTLASCPSFVSQVYPYGGRPRPNSAMPSLYQLENAPVTMPRQYDIVSATLLAPLPPLTCGTIYKPATMALQPQSDWSVQDEFGGFQIGRASTTALVEIDLSSDGKVVNAAIAHSSGNHITDTEAVDQAKTETYSPAEFLCTPVVSVLFMQYAQK